MMWWRTLRCLCCLALAWTPLLQAASGVITDPRSTERQSAPADAVLKLVSLDFEAVDKDARAERRARELRAQLHALSELGVETVFERASSDRLREQAAAVARRTQAQLVLWGRILVDADGTLLIKSSLLLSRPPPGIGARYATRADLGVGAAPVEVRGVIDAPVTSTRLDFNTVDNEVSSVIDFLSGLLRYYRAAQGGGDTARNLNGSIADFRSYLSVMPEKLDRSALAQAQLYLARAYVRLAEAEPARASAHLAAARSAAEQAAGLDRYDPDVPATQAVIGAKQGAPLAELRTPLMRAAVLAPTDANLLVNLAVLRSAEGDVAAAFRSLDQADWVQRVRDQPPLAAALALRRALAPYGKGIR